MKLNEHVEYCKKHEASLIVMPNPLETVKFNKLKSLLQTDVIIIADFKCFVIPISGVIPSPSTSHTTGIHHHEPCSFGYLICWHDGTETQPVIYRGENAAEKFLYQNGKRSTKHCRKVITNNINVIIFRRRRKI